MKKYLKIPTTGDKGDVYINVLSIAFAKPSTSTETILVGNATSGSGSVTEIYLVHAAETDNAMTRWWCDNVKRIINNPYTEVFFDATTPPFEVSNITFSS